MVIEVDSSPPQVDSGIFVIEFRNRGFRVVTRSMLGSLAKYSGTCTTGQSVESVEVSELSPVTKMVESDYKWEVPTIKHTWTAHSCQVREIARRFKKSIQADH